MVPGSGAIPIVDLTMLWGKIVRGLWKFGLETLLSAESLVDCCMSAWKKSDADNEGVMQTRPVVQRGPRLHLILAANLKMCKSFPGVLILKT